MRQADLIAGAQRVLAVFDEREDSPRVDLINEFIDDEIERRIELLIADDDGAERNRGAIDALRFVKDIPARERVRAVELIGDDE